MNYSFITFFIALIFSPLLTAQEASALSAADIFSDNMVLQRNAPINIWGTAKPKESIAISIHNTTTKITADEQGSWKTALPAMNAGGPFDMTISNGNKKITFSNILIGDVWVCSGQSNMEWPLQGRRNGKVQGSKEAIAAANLPKLRLLQVKKNCQKTPQKKLEGHWQVSSPTTAAAFSATAFFFGRKLNRETDIPIGLIQVAWGGSSCQAWHREENLRKNFPEFNKVLNKQKSKKGRLNHRSPSGLFNGMIAPILPYSIAGFIWYQGESNHQKPHQYRKLFPNMVKDWRQLFNQGELPFYYCQIAPFKYKIKDAGVKIREAQRESLKRIPNSGMAVLADKTTVQNIHPPYKLEAGERLAFWALKNLYKKELIESGPIFREAKVNKGSIQLMFDYSEGLSFKKSDKNAAIFEIAGEDGNFLPAQALIEGETIILKNATISEPRFARYGWNNIATGNLINGANLPASSFTTQKWK